VFESNDLTIRSCWIRQGSCNTITGEWQLIRYTASCRRHFSLQEWIPLKELHQVLRLFRIGCSSDFFFCCIVYIIESWMQGMWRNYTIKCLTL